LTAKHLPLIQDFFDPETWTYTYVVYEGNGSPCVIIDSVLNYDPKSGRTSTRSADEIIAFVNARQLEVSWILETHAHADHLTAAPYLQDHLGGKLVIGDHITNVQTVFKGVFNLDDRFKADGTQFDRLLKEGESLSFWQLVIKGALCAGPYPGLHGL
jgi:glyoxylase-like metal-dependent hydrolase (beta-lactamase superfamily II)